MANAGKQLSRVSYLKAIDWFLMGNAVFVFLSLVEYLFVLNISASISPWSEKKRKVSPTVNKAVLWLTAYYLLTRCEVVLGNTMQRIFLQLELLHRALQQCFAKDMKTMT